ncbi:MAG: hypothetical protein NTW21_38610 [Verrucomicrobia bacterium]|nr:hypothetical protein [Verrucomicrobiota bacterium]
MNFRLSLAVLAASLVIVTAADQPSVLSFANKEMDQLSGTFDSLNAGQLVWVSPILEKPTPFWLKSVLELTVPATLPDFKATHEATLTLMNANTIRGQIAAVTDDTITIDTWYAGRLNFRRVMVKQVDIDEQPSLVFSGPIGLDGWIQTAEVPTWTYEYGTLRTSTNQGIGRDVGLPDGCSIGFEVAWEGNLRLNFNFFTDAVTSDSPTRGYQISCQGSYASIRGMQQNAGMQFGDGANIPEFKENEKVRIEVRASRTSGHICLYVNGRCAALWKDPGVAKAKLGKCIQFVPQGKEAIRISGIKVAVWDGSLDELADEQGALLGMGMGLRRFQLGGGIQEPKPEPKPKAGEDGRMKLRNGDSIAGEVTAVVEGEITIKTPYAEVKLPVARVRNIVLKPAALEEPIRRNGDVRAWFVDGSSIVFCLDAMTAEAITGHSQSFGTATFKLAAFNRLEFNIYDPQINDLRAKKGL